MLRLSMMIGARERLAPNLTGVSTSVLCALRVVLYLIVTVAAFGTIVLLAIRSPVPSTLFEENGPWEWLQFSLVVASAAICFINARRNEIFTHILKLCGLFALFAAFRELDYFMEELMFDGAYKVINGVILALFLYIAWTHRWMLIYTLARFTRTAPFYFFAAAVLVVVYGEIIGQAELWQALMGDGYIRSVKRVAEELAEFMAYLLLFYGAVETCFLKDDQAYDSIPRVGEARIPR